MFLRIAVWSAVLTLSGAAEVQMATAAEGRVFTIGGAADLLRRVQLRPPHDGGLATAANLGGGDVAVAADGAVLVAAGDVWRIGLDGRLLRMAGNGHDGFGGDGGPARAAAVSAGAVSVMADGGFLIADTGNHRIRRVWPDGTISTVAGSGPLGGTLPSGQPRPGGFGGDGGPATAAQLSLPGDVAALPDGGFLIADTGNHRIRRVWPDGTITTVAGSAGDEKPEGLGDGGPATAAALDTPSGVAPAPVGGFYIADTFSSRIARVAADGVISTVAGIRDASGFTGDGGPATRARLDYPVAVAADHRGGLYIADSTNNRVRRVAVDGRISTVAGSGRDVRPRTGLSDDGEHATAAVISSPTSVERTPDGGLVIATSDGVRYVSPDVPGRLAVALLARRGLASSRGYRARVLTTVSSRVTVTTRVGAALVSAHGQTTAGVATDISIRRQVPPGLYTVAVSADAGGAQATHRIRLILGGRLEVRLVERALNDLGLGSDGTNVYATRCHRFTARRVDCKLDERSAEEPEPASCFDVAAVRLMPSGLPRVRLYSCPRRSQKLFRVRPRWRGPSAWLDIPLMR